MKTRIFYLLGCSLILFSFAKAEVPSEYRWTQWVLTVGTSTPPGCIYLEDAQGRKAGANVNLPFNEHGGQGDLISGLEEIPLSSVEQQNIGGDDPATAGQMQAKTGWFVRIYDQPAQTFTLHVVGLSDGTAVITKKVFVGRRASNDFGSKINVLLTKGCQKKYRLEFDPGKREIKSLPVLGDSGLNQDVKAACDLSLIRSKQVCERLLKKATAIHEALEDGCDRKAEELIRSFLRTLGESRPKQCEDVDDHASVKEPALTILKEDARALLESLGKGHRQDDRDCWYDKEKPKNHR